MEGGKKGERGEEKRSIHIVYITCTTLHSSPMIQMTPFPQAIKRKIHINCMHFDFTDT